MIVINLIPTHQIILLPKRTSQSQVTTKNYSDEKQRHKHGKPVFFLIIYIQIQKQTVIGHMVVLHMLQLNIMFKMMILRLFTRQLIYH